jgi:hypothetical protein
LTKKKTVKKENLGRYFISGIIIAGLLFVVLTMTRKDSEPDVITNPYWSVEMESLFVKTCYEKYKPQVKDDMARQESSKFFCRCMLEKVKSKYDEQSAQYITDEEAKKWGAECTSRILNPNFK